MNTRDLNAALFVLARSCSEAPDGPEADAAKVLSLLGLCLSRGTTADMVAALEPLVARELARAEADAADWIRRH